MNTRIKQIRNALNLSQDNLAEIMGLSPSGISNIECGNRKVNDKHIRMLEMSLNVNPDWLRTGEGEMFIPVDNSILANLQKEYNLSPDAMVIVENFLQMNNKQRDELILSFKALIRN